MLLKKADDKSKRVALLEDLQKSLLLNYEQQTWLREELWRLRRGIQGERDAAHYIDNYFKDGVNHVVMHDLRFVVDGDVAQIDHLIFGRASQIYLLETKNYGCNVIINDNGEFTVEYEKRRFGIPSPIEQSHRHERILTKLLERLGIVGRTQAKPDIHHVVMFHPKATIERPSTKAFDTSNIIKADQFPMWHQRFVDSAGIGTVVKFALNMRNMETIQEWCEKLVRQHRRADLLELPDFMKPQAPQEKPQTVVSFANTIERKVSSAKPTLSVTPQESRQSGNAQELAHRLICAKCKTKISFAEGKFCWNNPERFGGLQYCRAHQSVIQ